MELHLFEGAQLRGKLTQQPTSFCFLFLFFFFNRARCGVARSCQPCSAHPHGLSCGVSWALSSSLPWLCPPSAHPREWGERWGCADSEKPSSSNCQGAAAQGAARSEVGHAQALPPMLDKWGPIPRLASRCSPKVSLSMVNMGARVLPV